MSASAQQPSPLRRVAADAAAGPAAVIVDDVPLIHTAQLLPLDDAGRVVALGDAGRQLDKLLDNLRSALRAAGSDLAQTAKLNLYVAREDLGPVVLKLLGERWPDPARPAVSLVVTSLPSPAALVALDAIAARPAPLAADAVMHSTQAAVLPAGSRLYVSGQAERGTLREATGKTLESLSATLQHCGRSDRDIVQLKCFLQPMQSVAEVQDEIARYFRDQAVPPVSYVEWRMPGPIEIELVAWGGPAQADAAQPLEFITPPGMTASPLYCRVVRIGRGGTIYFADLHGPQQAAGEEQLQVAFDSLRGLLAKSGSDLTHLVKATYYVTDDEIARAHNAIRPRYYDPARPPAASKAIVAGTGRGGRYVMDMIAFPRSLP
jgi:enamine deaminase RidA (YjgF/YER057c/UK114 family)